MSTVIHERVALCRAGRYEPMVCRVKSGWVVMGETQFLRGYALIYPDPVVGQLNELDAEARKQLMYDASIVGDALLELTGAVRINYEILGNLAPALHMHIFPRYRDEAENLRTRPVWFYDWDAGPTFDAAQDAELAAGIRDYCVRRLGVIS